MGHDDVEELLAAFALGDLDDGQRAELEAHVCECPSCDERLVGFERVLELHVVETCACAGANAEPSLAVRASLMQQIALESPARGGAQASTAEDVAEPVTRPAVSRPRRVRFRRRWPAYGSPALAVACLALVALGIVQTARISSLHGQRHSATMLDSGAVSSLATSGQLSAVHGQLVDDRGSGLLVLGDMPDPPPNHVWHAWLEGPHHTVQSVEEISHGGPMMYVPVGQLDDPMSGGSTRPRAVVITLEAPNATQPAGPMLARVDV